MSRNISAKELLELASYHRKEGDELLALGYEREEKDLQDEMNSN